MTIEAGYSSILKSDLLDFCRGAIVELEQYELLGYGWDGYTGKPFDPQGIFQAKSIVYQIESYFIFGSVNPSEITPGPSPRGTIDIEITLGEKVLIFTVSPDGSKLGIYREQNGECEKETEDNFSLDIVAQELSWLLPSTVSTEILDQPGESAA